MIIPPEPENEDASPPADDEALVIPVVEADEQADQPPVHVAGRSFEDLTLAQAVGQFLRAPLLTWQAMRAVALTPRFERGAVMDLPPLPAQSTQEENTATPAPAVIADKPSIRLHLDADQRREAAQFGMRLGAFLLAWWGNGILANAPIRTESLALDVGAPYLLAAFGLWLAAEFYGDWPGIRDWWRRRREQPAQESAVQPASPTRPAVWMGIHPVRVLLALGGLFCSLVALRFTAGNQFTPVGFWTWIVSVILWTSALAPRSWLTALSPRRARQWAQGFDWRTNWVLWALVVIVLLAASMRLVDLPRTPFEMTSDHVEKILDSQRVLNGNHQVFFPNNGGREGFQMYAMALFSQLPGQGMNFTTLKLLSALEGMVAVVLMYWLGRAALRDEDQRLAKLVGLLLAALVAVSYWHTALSRLGLRIVITTIITTLLLIFLARGLRYNRRGDFILAGLVLGFGLYTYQAVRMLPVVIIIGMLLVFVFKVRTLKQAARYLLNFTILVVVAFIVFVPLFGYSLQYPEDFWRRTSGRLLGDDVVEEIAEDGTVTRRNATIEERLDAFSKNLPILANNTRNALLMFNWKGDVAWINAAPNRPALDVFTGALFVVGLAAWLARMLRRRDVFDWLLPLVLLIMLLPSALSIAYPVENPSHTRTSGALPPVYLIAALPFGLLIHSTLRLSRGRGGIVASGVLAGFIILGAHSLNSRIYFNDYHQSYLNSTPGPYTEAGRVLYGFAVSDGGYGNAFLVGYQHWWDHRAVGIEGGLEAEPWPNGVVDRDTIPRLIVEGAGRTDKYRFDPERDILFFYSPQDDVTEALLQSLFPDGYATYRQSYLPDEDYKLFRVPRLGTERFYDFMVEHISG